MAMQDKGSGESNDVRFFELIFQEDRCVPQTWMQKQHKYRFTHTRPAGDEVQLDHVITPIQWRNIITDVSTVPGAALNSNHYLVKVNKGQYNRRVVSKFNHQHTNLPVSHREDKQTATNYTRCSHALAETITEEQKAPKQPWITKATWDLIQQRIRAREAGDKATEQDLHKQVRSYARHDKTQWLKDRLAESEETVNARMKSKWIERIRSEYKQRPASLKNHEGKPTSCSKLAQTFAEHLSHQQWAPPQHYYTGSDEPILHSAAVDQSPITVSELDYALAKSAKHRAAGIDDIPTEAWQWLDSDNRTYLLNLLNDAWASQSILQEW